MEALVAVSDIPPTVLSWEEVRPQQVLLTAEAAVTYYCKVKHTISQMHF